MTTTPMDPGPLAPLEPGDTGAEPAPTPDVQPSLPDPDGPPPA